MEKLHHLPQDLQKKISSWLHSPYDKSTQQQVKELLHQQEDKIKDAFYTDLTFGTAGLRGIMGVGSNRINKYTIGKATQGLANYILETPYEGIKRVAISYDCRLHSEEFAKETACILAANHIEVYLTKSLRPTPFLSFCVRNKHCIAGIMITASHNPPEYNGYKVYWQDGGQIVPPQEIHIIEHIHRIDHIQQIKTSSLDNPLIKYLDEDDDEAYIRALLPLQMHPDINTKEGHHLKILYSNMHGTGITLLPDALFSWGFTNLHFVEKQKNPDGTFPSAPNPNPELKSAMEEGLFLLKKDHYDLFLATDPDADRVGVAVMHRSSPKLLNGHEIATLCAFYLLSNLKQQKRLSTNHVIIASIVTTPLLKRLCQHFNIKFISVLTGFKYIGQKILSLESSLKEEEFLFGAEESYGYLYGSHCRDKDALVSSCLLSEMTLWCKKQQMTLIDFLYKIYTLFGVYQERQLSIQLEEGQKSHQLILAAMEHLRSSPPSHLEGLKILSIADYMTRVQTETTTQKTHPLDLPKSNALAYTLEDNSQFIIRPSGTEPKIKIYASIQKHPDGEVEDTIHHCQKVLRRRLEIVKEQLLKL
jgi:phosphomannomutase